MVSPWPDEERGRNRPAGDKDRDDCKPQTHSHRARVRPGYDRKVRFPVVLFDLDGTLIDSTSMILASFQHATRTVLGREIPPAEIFAVVGGPTLEAQMRSFSPERVDELVAVYRAHNTPLHQELELCAGM